MIKLIALDMDGTLLTDDKKIPEENITAIHAAIAAGVKLVLCTGRPLVGVKPYLAQLGLSQEDEYVIVNNGATTHKTSDWSLVDYRSLSKEDLIYLSRIGQSSPAQACIFDTEDYLVLDEEPNSLVQTDAAYVFTQAKKITLNQALESANIYFQAMFLAQPEELDQFEADFGPELEERFSCVRSQEVIFETMPLGTTKASALAALAKRLGIEPSQIMAMGDGNNDLEMLEFAGLGVAMGNASDLVKEKAKAVTSSNNQAGVARAIYDHILITKKDA